MERNIYTEIYITEKGGENEKDTNRDIQTEKGPE